MYKCNTITYELKLHDITCVTQTNKSSTCAVKMYIIGSKSIYSSVTNHIYWISGFYIDLSTSFHYTLPWKEYYALLPAITSSGHHSDGVVRVALEASESGLSSCWVTELQGGLITSFRTVGHTSGVGSWAWTSPLPRYLDTWGTCELSSDFSRCGRG